MSKQIRIGGRFSKRRNEIGGPVGPHVKMCAADGMREGESGRVEQLAGREGLEALAPRQLLHAAQLAFAHPVSGARLVLRSEWPADLMPALASAAADPNLLAQRNPLQYLGFFASDE